MDDNEQQQQGDDAATDEDAQTGEPKSDVAEDIENDPAHNPDDEHMKDLKGA